MKGYEVQEGLLDFHAYDGGDKSLFMGLLVAADVYRPNVFGKTKSASGQYVSTWFVIACGRCECVWYTYVPPLLHSELCARYGMSKSSTRKKLVEQRAYDNGFRIVSTGLFDGWVCPECARDVEMEGGRIWALGSRGRPRAMFDERTFE